jgi:3-deoxy-alpha-D-manno-octulosonate 8-oxidase
MAYQLCKDVFLENGSIEENQDKLMMASWHGGMSIAYSQVGVAHALSYGLSFVLGIKHGIGNCIVFNNLKEFYPTDVALFKSMLKKHEISLPKGVCKSLLPNQLNAMVDVALSLTPLWENAIGEDWQSMITRSKLESLYLKM